MQIFNDSYYLPIIHRAIIEYQQKNNVVRQCFENSIIFKDFGDQVIKPLKIELMAGILIYPTPRTDAEYIHCVHVWAMIDGLVIECSEEYGRIPTDLLHYMSFKGWFSKYKDDEYMDTETRRTVISAWLDFHKKIELVQYDGSYSNPYMIELRNHVAEVLIRSGCKLRPSK